MEQRTPGPLRTYEINSGQPKVTSKGTFGINTSITETLTAHLDQLYSSNLCSEPFHDYSTCLESSSSPELRLGSEITSSKKLLIVEILQLQLRESLTL